MNTGQRYLLEEHDLSIRMIYALSTLVEGEKLRYYTRSYEALHRRGLATEDFQITEPGSRLYQSYCSLGKSIGEQVEEHRQKSRNLVVANTVGKPSEAPQEHHEQDLQTVIDCWPGLPSYLRKIIVVAARRIANL